jgi:hypothetical protein
MNMTWNRNWSKHLAIRYGATVFLCISCVLLFLHTIAGPDTVKLKPGLRKLVESRNEAKYVDTEHGTPDVGLDLKMLTGCWNCTTTCLFGLTFTLQIGLSSLVA